MPNTPPVSFAEIERLLEHKAVLDALCHVELEPWTLGAILGLLEGLADGDREVRIRRRGEDTILEVTRAEHPGVRFRGPSLTQCLSAAAQHEPEKPDASAESAPDDTEEPG